MTYPHIDPYNRFNPVAPLVSVSALVSSLSKGLDRTDCNVWSRGVSSRLADIMTWRVLIENGGLDYVTWWMHCDSVLWKGEGSSRTYRNVPKAFEELRDAERFADALARAGGFSVHAYTVTKRSFGSRRFVEGMIETHLGVHEARWCENEAYALSLAALSTYAATLAA